MEVVLKQPLSWCSYVCRVVLASIPNLESKVVPTVMQENTHQTNRPIVQLATLEGGPQKAGERVNSARQGRIALVMGPKQEQIVWLVQ